MNHSLRPFGRTRLGKIPTLAAITLGLPLAGSEGFAQSVWDGSSSNVLSLADNWTPAGAPTTNSALLFDGTDPSTSGGNFLTMGTGAVGGATGVASVSVTQSNALDFQSGNSSGGLRLNDGGTFTVSAGAGAVTFGSNARLILGGGTEANTMSFTLTNNSSNAVTIASNANGNWVGGSNTSSIRNVTFGGSGNWDWQRGLSPVNVAYHVTKTGTGTMSVSGASTFAASGGSWTVSNGKLRLTNSTGSATGDANVAVAVSGGPGATLAGTGFAAGNVTLTNGSRIAAGINTTDADGSGRNNFGSAGTLSLATAATSTLTLTHASLDFDLANVATIGGNINDLLLTDALSLGTSNITFSFNALNGTLATATKYTLIDATDVIGGAFDPANFTTAFYGVTGLGVGETYSATYSIDNATNRLQVEFGVVPEPATSVLLLGGFGAVLLLRRRTR